MSSATLLPVSEWAVGPKERTATNQPMPIERILENFFRELIVDFLGSRIEHHERADRVIHRVERWNPASQQIQCIGALRRREPDVRNEALFQRRRGLGQLVEQRKMAGDPVVTRMV